MQNFTMTILALLFSVAAWGQRTAPRNNEGGLINVNISYAYQIPAGDLVDRFGNNFNAGGGVDFITKNNLIFGTQAYYLFGNEVKPNLVKDLSRTLASGEAAVYGNAQIGEPSAFRFKERGFYVGGHVGKLFSMSKDNPRSGIRVTIGAGYLQHKIRLQDDPQAFVAVFGGDYKQGWDKLTSGLGITEFVGYQLLSKNRRINIAIGFELTQGFTQNRRDYDFFTRNVEIDNSKRKDHLLGLRFNWSLPLYFEGKSEEIFY